MAELSYETIAILRLTEKERKVLDLYLRAQCGNEDVQKAVKKSLTDDGYQIDDEDWRVLNGIFDVL
jgi:hypothetical protein